MFDEFIRTNGRAFSDGVLLQLFGDLDTQEADEQHRLSQHLKEKYEARALLVQLYRFTKAVSSTNQVYVPAWGAAEKARFIRTLAHYKSQKIDEAVSGILTTITDDDYLAVACIDRLFSQGYDTQIRTYCEQRIPKSEHFAAALRQVIAKLDSRNGTNTHQ